MIALVVDVARRRISVEIDQHLLDRFTTLVRGLAVHPLAVLREQRGVAGIVARILPGGVLDEHTLDRELILHALQALLDRRASGLRDRQGWHREDQRNENPRKHGVT